MTDLILDQLLCSAEVYVYKNELFFTSTPDSKCKSLPLKIFNGLLTIKYDNTLYFNQIFPTVKCIVLNSSNESSAPYSDFVEYDFDICKLFPNVEVIVAESENIDKIANKLYQYGDNIIGFNLVGSSSKIDLNIFKNLEWLDCPNSDISEAQFIKCQKLKHIWCSNTKIDFNNFPNLESINIDFDEIYTNNDFDNILNKNKITNLNLECTKITMLKGFNNLNSLFVYDSKNMIE